MRLKFLPKFQDRNNERYKFSDLEDEANKFLGQHEALQEAILDCVIAISKIAMHLRNAIYADSQVLRYE